MPYAEGRTYYDADSHIMELPDWLVEFADPDIRDRIRPLYLGAAGKLADNAMRDAEARTREAVQFALQRGSRSGRVAWQFARSYAGAAGLRRKPGA